MANRLTQSEVGAESMGKKYANWPSALIKAKVVQTMAEPIAL
jgi:hypothetical protein